jgi:hypothetical protein
MDATKADAALERKLAERDRKIGELEGELKEVRGMLGDVLTRLGQNDEKLKNIVADVSAEHKDRVALIGKFETALAEMRGRVSAILRDWS